MLGGSGAGRLAQQVVDESRIDDAHTSTTDAAWAAAILSGLVLVTAALLIASRLSHALYPTPSLQLLPEDTGVLAPEPGESTRYLLALCAVVLQVTVTIAIARSRLRIPLLGRRPVIASAQLLLVGLLATCLAAQHTHRWAIGYFTPTSLVVAAAIAAGLVLLTRGGWARGFAPRLPASRAWTALLWLVALAATVIWVLSAINSERSVAWAALSHDTAFHLDETFAVINGLTPLVDFNAQYASLFPYGIALSMVTFGKTLLVFTITVSALTVLALLAVYGVIRRAAPSPTVALLLFLPFMATSLFDPFGYGMIHFTSATYFPMLPFRYGAPFLMAWLVAWQLGREQRAYVWLLFGTAGLAILNNFEFGVAAFGATIAALLCTEARWHRRSLARLAAGAGLGILGALAVYSLFALVRAGGLPDLTRMPQFARLYGVAGYSVAPMPSLLGLPLAIFLTYAAAIATATVRALERAPNRVLTGMLAWSGVFGLGTAAYWVARSDSILLVTMFPAWALTLVMLTLVVLEWLAARPERRPGPAALAVLFGFGLATCSLAQIPAPWNQVARLQDKPPRAIAAPVPWAPAPSGDARERTFVSSIGDGVNHFVVRRGAPIALFRTTGHRIADAYGVADVVPFTGPESMHTLEQFEEALEALRRAGGNTVLLPRNNVDGLHEALERRGFRLLTDEGIRNAPISNAEFSFTPLIVAGLTKWVDMSRPRAPWLE